MRCREAEFNNMTMSANPLWALTQAANQASKLSNHTTSHSPKFPTEPEEDGARDNLHSKPSRRTQDSRPDEPADWHASVPMPAMGRVSGPSRDILFRHSENGSFMSPKARNLGLEEMIAAPDHHTQHSHLAEQRADEYASGPAQNVVRPCPRRRPVPGQNKFQPLPEPVRCEQYVPHRSYAPGCEFRDHDGVRMMGLLKPDSSLKRAIKKPGNDEKMRQKKRLRNEAEKKRIRKESDTIAMLRGELALHVEPERDNENLDADRMSRQEVLDSTLHQLHKLRKEFDTDVPTDSTYNSIKSEASTMENTTRSQTLMQVG